MSSREKILVILTPAFPATSSDENWVPSQQSFLRSVKRLFPGLKVIICSFIYPYKKDNYKWHDLEVISFNGNEYRKIRRPLLWRQVWHKLNELDKKHKITAILSFWCAECALVGHYFSRRNSINHKIWICGQDARKKNRLVRLIRPSGNELVAKSDFLTNEFYKNHHIKAAHLIPNGVDKTLFSQKQFVRDIDIIGAGSLNSIKRYDIFLEIVFELKKNLPGIKTILVGDGEQRELIRKMREDLKLQENVEMKGMLTPGETVHLMQRSKILLHPSSYEGFSMATCEALYAGAHVISFVKTMHHDIKNWHVVNTQEEMLMKANELLNTPLLDHSPVFTYSMDDSAVEMINLLGLLD